MTMAFVVRTTVAGVGGGIVGAWVAAHSDSLFLAFLCGVAFGTILTMMPDHWFWR